MALQDLTPQLRTRLSRMERAVGWFVFLATAFLLAGFAYYIYSMAERKGWFIPKARYFTFTDTATGLKVGDPVKLMGFDVGQITRIDAQPPFNYYNVYVEFEIMDRYNGYLWTTGSVARVAGVGLLGQRELEVTKGAGGYPAYLFHPLKELTVREAQNLSDPGKWRLAREIRDATGSNVLLRAWTALWKSNLVRLAELPGGKIPALDLRKRTPLPTAVWSAKAGAYEPFWKTNLYWLPADETPALTERLEKLVTQVEQALPNYLALTNPIARVLNNSATLTSNLNVVALNTQQAVSNVAAITADLRGGEPYNTW